MNKHWKYRSVVAYCKHASNVFQDQSTTINPATGKIITSPNDHLPPITYANALCFLGTVCAKLVEDIMTILENTNSQDLELEWVAWFWILEG